MKMTKSLLVSLLILSAVGSFFSACVKKEYDEPEINNTDPNLTNANFTVDWIKYWQVAGQGTLYKK